VIHLVDRAVERFLRQAVPLAEATVDVSFNAPDRTWGAGLTRPAVNVFLWEVTRNPSFQRSGMQQRIADDGAIQRRPATPVVDLHYLVTAWATELADEHQLLGNILTSILAHRRLPEEVLPDSLAGTRIGLHLADADKRVPGEFWSALDGRLKPGLQLELNLPLEVFEWAATAPPAEEVAAQVVRQARAGHGEVQPSRAREDPVLRRRRLGGAVVMEGRTAPASSEPGDSGSDGTG
jgi:hypothetical protein